MLAPTGQRILLISPLWPWTPPRSRCKTSRHCFVSRRRGSRVCSLATFRLATLCPLRLDYQAVLAAYPDDCQPRTIESLGTSGGLSGGRDCGGSPRRVAHCSCAAGLRSIRRASAWNSSRPCCGTCSKKVSRHVPLPLETRKQRGYVVARRTFLELAPWLPGRSDYRQARSVARVANALRALADFHLAAASFPLADPVQRRCPALPNDWNSCAACLPGNSTACATPCST